MKLVRRFQASARRRVSYHLLAKGRAVNEGLEAVAKVYSKAVSNAIEVQRTITRQTMTSGAEPGVQPALVKQH